jgi:porphobilinogen synthase
MMMIERPRRLRRNALIRDLVRETKLSSDDLIQPYFVSETATEPEPISSMPGQMRHTIESLVAACAASAQAGIKAVILFGIPDEKDAEGHGADADDGIIQKAIRALKASSVELLVISDVCLCEYTDHGHCGLLEGEEILNDESLERLAATAVSHAEAGADMVAPSDMLDGRIAVIREALDEAGHEQIGLISYAVKYASAFYGPFRDAAQSAPSFGDRRSHQMDPANRREALREAQLDVEEGADAILVKPALAYLDVVRELREEIDLPLLAYSVSGEYAMIEAAAAKGWIDRQAVVLESLLSMKRAGVDVIMTYHATEVAGWLR